MQSSLVLAPALGGDDGRLVQTGLVLSAKVGVVAGVEAAGEVRARLWRGKSAFCRGLHTAAALTIDWPFGPAALVS